MEEAVLTHVIYVANTPGLEEMLAEESRPVLERQKKLLEAQGVKVTVEMPFGLTAHTLDETAEKHDVSGILIGSHGKGILQAATLGVVPRGAGRPSRSGTGARAGMTKRNG
jgi:nucleotide-binding universal stress UspA family protein